jgi:hypothetical protein
VFSLLSVVDVFSLNATPDMLIEKKYCESAVALELCGIVGEDCTLFSLHCIVSLMSIYYFTFASSLKFLKIRHDKR